MRRILLSIAATSLAATAAIAASPGGAASAVSHGLFHPAGGSTRNLQQSSNWSGLAATSGGYTRVTGTWNVPKVTVTSTNRYAADWVGIGGYNTQDLIQAGTAEESVNGTAHYYAWTEILPAPEAKIARFAVHPGNSITVDVNQVSTGSWTITVTNHSTGKTAVKNLNYVSTHASAEWIHEAPTVGGSQARLATTTNADFDHGTVNGSTVAGSAGGLQFIQLVGPTDATPSGLDSDSDGLAVADGAVAPPPPGS